MTLSKHNIVYIGDVPSLVRDELYSRLPDGFSLSLWTEKPTDQERKELLRQAHFIMGFPRTLSQDELELAKNLKLVQLLSAGYDSFDIDLAKKYGVLVANNGGANSTAVAEHTILMILALYKKFCKNDNGLRRGAWLREKDYSVNMFELTGRAVGIIGFGNIGKALARCLKGFLVDLKYYDIVRYEAAEKALDAKYTTFEDVLKTSDIVTLHVPLTELTKNMIGKKELQLMKKSAVLINTSRGKVVNENDLLEALKTKRITGAALDVFEKEGIPYSPVNNVQQICEDPQIKFRDMLVEIDQPGIGKMKIAGSPLRLSETPGRVYRGAPALGEHSEEILMTLLKKKKAEITALRREGVIN